MNQLEDAMNKMEKIKGDLQAAASELSEEKSKLEKERRDADQTKAKLEKEMEERGKMWESRHKASNDLVEQLRSSAEKQRATLAALEADLVESKSTVKFYEGKLRKSEKNRLDPTNIASQVVEEFKNSEDGRNCVTLAMGTQLVDFARGIMDFVNSHCHAL